MTNRKPPREHPCRPAPLPRRRPRPGFPRLVDILAPALSALVLLAVATPAHALPIPPAGTAAPAAANCNGNATCDLDETLSNVQFFLIGIAVLIAGVAFALFGIQHMTGALEDQPAEKRLSRKKQFTAIAVGLAITLLSAVMVGVAKGLIVTT